MVAGTQVAQGWASRPGFHPPPRATLTWRLPHPSPSTKAGSWEGESFSPRPRLSQGWDRHTPRGEGTVETGPRKETLRKL